MGVWRSEQDSASFRGARTALTPNPGSALTGCGVWSKQPPLTTSIRDARSDASQLSTPSGWLWCLQCFGGEDSDPRLNSRERVTWSVTNSCHRGRRLERQPQCHLLAIPDPEKHPGLQRQLHKYVAALTWPADLTKVRKQRNVFSTTGYPHGNKWTWPLYRATHN